MKNIDLSSILKKFKELNIEFFELLTLDLKGRMHLLVLPSKMLDDSFLKNGVGFDASAYGFSKPEKSDMVLIPDLNTMFFDPFREKKTAGFLANIHCTDERRSRFNQDPRFVAEKAEKALINSRIGSEALFGPEYEFFIFKKADYRVNEDGNYYYLERDTHHGRNLYHATAPDDEYIDFRNEASSIMQDIEIEIKYHHHEVAVNQHEIETSFNGLVKTGDQSVKIKYVLFNLAKKNGLFLTFMPKPFFGKAGNGWHVHQFLMKNGKNIFFKKNNYANLSEVALNYISGQLFHSGSLCAFCNPSTNSYKRLVKGFEAPVTAIFATSNRNAAIRIPTYVKDNETRMEYRPGDASSNPYLNLSALLMAGIDGIHKNLMPEKYNFGPFDGEMPESKLIRNKIRELPESLQDALDHLEKDNEYLKFDDVFCDDLIMQWVKIKRDEVKEVNLIPHPKEFELYFDF